jgi:membrane glycosyltransferase
MTGATDPFLVNRRARASVTCGVLAYVIFALPIDSLRAYLLLAGIGLAVAAGVLAWLGMRHARTYDGVGTRLSVLGMALALTWVIFVTYWFVTGIAGVSALMYGPK